NVAKVAAAVRDAAAARIVEKVDTSGVENPVVVFNTLAQERQEVVELPNGELTYAEVPQCGYSVQSADPGLPEGVSPTRVVAGGDGYVLNNGLL
ncbi:hypothetical protein HW115_19595, partial [Verrucomicrobiaceae bacterium N1E253]